MILGAIEAGGTKFVCAVADEQFNVTERITIKTTDPETTMTQVVDFFKQYETDLAGIGIGSFGPIDAKTTSLTYGHITSTPKLKWRNFDFLNFLKGYFDIPMTFTSDVNASAVGEFHSADNQEVESLVYYTVGTGIGGGAVQKGELIGGQGFTEMGHQLIKRHSDDDYEGTCPYHGDCLEGLAAGPAILGRYEIEGKDLAEDHAYWEILAYYLAQCAVNTTQFYTPDKIIFGGGVMKQEHLFPKIREQFKALNQDYMAVGDLECYITGPSLGDDAAVLGCLEMIKAALSDA